MSINHVIQMRSPTFIKPDEINPWIKDQIWKAQLPTISAPTVTNFMTCGWDEPPRIGAYRKVRCSIQTNGPTNQPTNQNTKGTIATGRDLMRKRVRSRVKSCPGASRLFCKWTIFSRSVTPPTLMRYLPNSSRAVWVIPPNSLLMACSIELECFFWYSSNTTFRWSYVRPVRILKKPDSSVPSLPSPALYKA